MAEIEGLVRALREGDDAAKAEAARALGNLTGGAGAGEPPEDDAANQWSDEEDNQVLIAEAGGIPLLVALLRDGSAEAKEQAAWALYWVATCNAANKVRIAAAGGIPALGDLLRDGSADAKLSATLVLEILAYNNAANAVAIAAAVGLEALVQLARRGCVTVDNPHYPGPLGQFSRNVVVVYDAGVPAKRKAALVVAALLGDCVPDSVPREIKAAIGSYF